MPCVQTGIPVITDRHRAKRKGFAAYLNSQSMLLGVPGSILSFWIMDISGAVIKLWWICQDS